MATFIFYAVVLFVIISKVRDKLGPMANPESARRRRRSRVRIGRGADPKFGELTPGRSKAPEVPSLDSLAEPPPLPASPADVPRSSSWNWTPSKPGDSEAEPRSTTPLWIPPSPELREAAELEPSSPEPVGEPAAPGESPRTDPPEQPAPAFEPLAAEAPPVEALPVEALPVESAAGPSPSTVPDDEGSRLRAALLEAVSAAPPFDPGARPRFSISSSLVRPTQDLATAVFAARGQAASSGREPWKSFAKASRLFGLQPASPNRLDAPRLADAIHRISSAGPKLRGPLVGGLLGLLGSPHEDWDSRLAERLRALLPES